jgi:hypothetical protein
MKITDPQVIEDGEKDLINAVQEDLDLDAVKQILKDRMGASTLSSKGGQIVVHNNKIAFRLDFDINLSGSLLFDRKGNYIDTGEEEPLEPARDPEMALEGFDAEDSLTDKGIEPPYDGIPLVDTGLDETDPDEIDTAEPDLSDQNLEDELSIGLPEYDLEEPEYKMELTDQEKVDTQNLENESLEGNDLTDEAVLQEEMLDDDINGILKESREFWEQKKDS